MPVKTEIDWGRLDRYCADICRQTLREHLTEVAAKDQRFSKKLKEALVGKNVRNHPVRVGSQVGGFIWSRAKSFVPFGGVAEYLRKGISLAATTYLNRQTAQGNDRASWARDLFQIEGTQIHTKMQSLDYHVESIFLWQTAMSDLIDDRESLKKASARASLIKAFSKVLLHYREAEKVIGELEPLIEDKARILDEYTELWSLGSDDDAKLGETSILMAETQFVGALLMDVEVHTTVCEESSCLISKNPLHMAEFIKDVVTLPPISLRSRDILEKSFLTSPNLLALGRMKGMLEKERNRLSPATYKPHVVGLQPAFQLLTLKQWTSFSDIGFWKSRGDETEAIDRVLDAYLKAAGDHFKNYQEVLASAVKADDDREMETLDNSIRMRAEIMTDVTARRETLSRISSATSEFIRVKSNKSSSQRRPYILMLDVLLQMEMDELAFAYAELEAD